MATNLLLSPEIKLSYERKLLQRFRTTTLFNKFGLQKSIPKGGGVALSFRRLESFRPVATASTTTWAFPDSTYTSASGAAITEGTFTTPAVVASWAEVTATVLQYGQAAYISDLDIEQAIDSQIPEYVENMSESMTELLDLVTRDVLLAATNIRCLARAA